MFKVILKKLPHIKSIQEADIVFSFAIVCVPKTKSLQIDLCVIAFVGTGQLFYFVCYIFYLYFLESWYLSI